MNRKAAKIVDCLYTQVHTYVNIHVYIHIYMYIYNII